MFNKLQSNAIIVKKYKEAHKVGKEIQSIYRPQGGSLEKGTSEERGRPTEQPPHCGRHRRPGWRSELRSHAVSYGSRERVQLFRA